MYIRPENRTLRTTGSWLAHPGEKSQVEPLGQCRRVMQRIRLQQYRQPGDALPDVRRRHLSFAAGQFFAKPPTVPDRLYSAGNSEVGPRHTLSATVKLFGKTPDAFCTLSNITGCDWEFASLTDGMRRTIDARQAWSGRLWKAGAARNFRRQKVPRRTVESAAETQRKRLVKTRNNKKLIRNFIPVTGRPPWKTKKPQRKPEHRTPSANDPRHPPPALIRQQQPVPPVGIPAGHQPPSESSSC